MDVTLACRLFGRCRQAFYQSKADIGKESLRERQLMSSVKEIREEDPRIGGYKLWLMLISMYGREYVPGRDRFFAILRRRGLMLPKPKPRHTTNSNHRYHKWKNLIKGLVPTSANRLWVSDITYIPLSNSDVCYLHLVTDAYSHKIVGWSLAESLKAVHTMEALQMAIDQAVAMRGEDDLTGLVHHSDRGVQYCCDDYVGLLQEHKISISMTEDYKPTDNAVAERINGIIKMESVYPQKRLPSLEYAQSFIRRFIHFYNNRRPHMSLAYKTPSVAHQESGEQEKKWRNMWADKNQATRNGENEEKSLLLQSRTTRRGEGIRQRA